LLIGCLLACSRAPHPPVQTAEMEREDVLEDARITEQIKEGLLSDPGLKESERIEVRTQRRVVTLTGRVASPEERDRILDIAAKVNEIRYIQDHLEIRPEEGASSVGDEELAGRIQELFLEDEHLSGEAIRVGVTRGTVTLRGQVEHAEQALRAERLAQQVPGVTKVKNFITIDSG